MSGSSPITIMYWTAVLIAGILLCWGAWRFIWRDYVRMVTKSEESRKPIPNALKQVIASLVLIAIYAGLISAGWQMLVRETASISDYKAPAETTEQKMVRESVPPTADELDAARTMQKERTQTKPHEEALDSFDATMEREAQKIKERSNK